MLQCWELEPEKRPPFTELVQSLSVSLEFMADYVSLGQQNNESKGQVFTSPMAINPIVTIVETLV